MSAYFVGVALEVVRYPYLLSFPDEVSHWFSWAQNPEVEPVFLLDIDVKMQSVKNIYIQKIERISLVWVDDLSSMVLVEVRFLIFDEPVYYLKNVGRASSNYLIDSDDVLLTLENILNLFRQRQFYFWVIH